MNTSVYILNISEVSAYKSGSDSSHSLFLSTSAPFKCKHRLHTVTGHFIFKEVKGHSTWRHSIAYSCEMNQDSNRIDNYQSATLPEIKRTLDFYMPDSLCNSRKGGKKGEIKRKKERKKRRDLIQGMQQKWFKYFTLSVNIWHSSWGC